MTRITNEQREAIVRKAIAERDAILADDKAQPAQAVDEIERWIKGVRDNILYQLAHRDDDALCQIAEGYGQESVSILAAIAECTKGPAPAVEDERKAFEEWALEQKHAYRDKNGIWFYGEGGHSKWVAWQARAALSERTKGTT